MASDAVLLIRYQERRNPALFFEYINNSQQVNGLWSGGVLLIIALLCLGFSTVSRANERHSDPDGCFSCHALEGLQFIDEDGLLRVSTIKKSHYYSSLHGSVPCKDCHRKITNYPHEVENGYVDCAESCHVNEPSEGEAYTHKPIVDEFKKSAHGRGMHKDFAGGNRLKEELDDQNPSCRKCHSNTLYIAEAQMDKFKDAFMHTETECGTCHVGDVWRDQFGGHILRRLVGSRWKKNDNNKMCNDCHADVEKMLKVELPDYKNKEKHKADYRWAHASESYARSLHSRLLVTDIEEGASCMDCHAPTKMGEFRHDIKRDEDITSSTHPNNLAETCAQSGCHEFALNPINSGFVQTDLHDIDQVMMPDWFSLIDKERLSSYWQLAFYPLLAFALFFIGGSMFWLFKGINDKKQNPLVGDEAFEKIIIGRKGKKSAKKKGATKKSPGARASATKEKGATERVARKPRAASTAKTSSPVTARTEKTTGQAESKANEKPAEKPPVPQQTVTEAEKTESKAENKSLKDSNTQGEDKNA